MAKRAIYFGFNPPFFGGQQNVLSRQEDERLIKNDIKQHLLTVPGDRVMRPDFGVPLRNFVFEQATDADLANLESEITAQLNTDKRFEVLTVQVVPSTDERNGIKVQVVVALKLDPTKVLTVEHFIMAGA